MDAKFKVGDKVRITPNAGFLPLFISTAAVGDEGVVTMLDEEGTIVTNEKFESGRPEEFGEHGVWLDNMFLEPVN